MFVENLVDDYKTAERDHSVNVIAPLKALELHDMGMTALNFHFEKKEIEIVVEIMEEVQTAEGNLQEVEKTIILHFTGVAGLRMGEMTEGNIFSYEAEIYSGDFTELQPGLYKAEFTMLLGISAPDWQFSFQFTDASVQDA